MLINDYQPHTVFTEFLPEASQSLKDRVVGLMGRVFYRGVDVLPFEE
jgi:hypothetical protein